MASRSPAQGVSDMDAFLDTPLFPMFFTAMAANDFVPPRLYSRLNRMINLFAHTLVSNAVLVYLASPGSRAICRSTDMNVDKYLQACPAYIMKSSLFSNNLALVAPQDRSYDTDVANMERSVPDFKAWARSNQAALCYASDPALMRPPCVLYPLHFKRSIRVSFNLALFHSNLLDETAHDFNSIHSQSAEVYRINPFFNVFSVVRWGLPANDRALVYFIRSFPIPEPVRQNALRILGTSIMSTDGPTIQSLITQELTKDFTYLYSLQVWLQALGYSVSFLRFQVP